MKRRLISAALIFVLVLVLPGMGTRANREIPEMRKKRKRIQTPMRWNRNEKIL